jgi:hypothetical protein
MVQIPGPNTNFGWKKHFGLAAFGLGPKTITQNTIKKLQVNFRNPFIPIQ